MAGVRPRAAGAALAACCLLGGCAGPAAGAGAPRIGDIDYQNFVYRGGCGWEKPGVDTVMTWDRQTGGAARIGALASRAQVVDTRRVRLGTPSRDYLLVRLQCSIGDSTATGWHLLGFDGSQSVDLGIVAAAYGPIDLRVADGQLAVSHAYRTTRDTGLSDSGRTSYRVAVSGLTPVRLYGDQQPGDIPAEVAHWPANAWRAGLVTLVEPSAAGPSYHLGVQVDPQTVLTADTLAVGDLCRPPTTWTHAGQRIDPLEAEGWTGRNGSLVRLSLPSDAPDLATVGRPVVPPTGGLHGLLVTASGIVPALAEVPAATTSGDVRVTSLAPADVALADSPFGGPAAVFRDASGQAVLSGGWAAPGRPAASGTSGASGASGASMQPLPDASVPPDVRCTTP